MEQKGSHNRNKPWQRSLKLSKAIFFLAALTSSHTFRVVNCEAKEFDWSDLGVSLTNPKTAYNGGSNNLRILVSPQRRMTKNYEFDYVNNSQPTSVQGETSYVLPSGSGSYVSSGHSSAYSALSASLASLKNRLNARGVTLNGQLTDGSSHPSLYSGATVSSFGSPVSDSQRSASPQQTYLSVANQQDQQSSGGFSSSQNQSNENKTIVLAIPAKINFLTDAQTSKQQQQQQSQQHQQQAPQNQQAQQLTLIQATPTDQQGRPDYVKQLGLLSGHDGTSETIVRDPNTEQEQQYVILNPAHTSGSEHPHLITSGLSNSQSSAPIYSSGIYQQAANTVKYIPAYQPAQSPGNLYEAQPVEQHYGSGSGSLCLDTCNSSDPRWKKYTVSKYKSCCSRSSQYDPQFDVPSYEKLGEASRVSDDAYYSYLYRKTRARRSRRPQRERHSTRYSRYSSSTPSSDPEGSSGEGANTESASPTKYNSARSHHYHDSPYVKYYKIRQQSYESGDNHEPGQYSTSAGRKYPNKERGYRRGHGREYESTEPQPNQEFSPDDEESIPSRGSVGYGSGEHSIESGRYTSTPNEDEEGRLFSGNDDTQEPEINKNGSAVDSSDYSDTELNLEEVEPETIPKYNSNKRRKSLRKSRGRKNGKESKYYGKAKVGRKSKQTKQDYGHLNGTDYDSVQSEEHNRPETSNTGEEDQSAGQREALGIENGESDKEATLSGNKYKSSLNDSAVVNLSKTTMHLKEILSMLEKKALIKVNETSTSQPNQLVTSTSTPPPPTTTNYYSSLFGSQFSNPSLTSSLSSDYITSELSLKSPYRDASSLSASLSLPSAYSSLADQFSSIPSFSSNQYSLGPSKHIPIPMAHHPRKRRVPKNIRYNQLMMSKPHGFSSSATLLSTMHGKNPFINSGYYQSMQYPYWYPRNSHQSAVNSYPFKSKNNYHSTLMNGPVSSKLAAVAAGSLYTDESRYNGATYNDPLTNVASSLRPSTTMRLRSKPFVFQPHVLPIYSRHTILTQPLDVKK